MRKHCNRKRRQASPPMLVNRGIQNDKLELAERQVVEAFSGGWATTEHFDAIAAMRNVLWVAATYKDDQQAINLCEAMRIPTANMRARYEKSGRLGASGPELELMRAFVSFYRDWWMRQPVALYVAASNEVDRVLSETQEVTA